jgi:dimethylhistidine N-methyltransferase
MAKSNCATAMVDTQPLPSEQEDFRELITGLKAKQKTINPKYFYDHLGSQLFEEITSLPEYYPTRTEIKLLGDNAGNIAELLGDNIYLIEPGAGSCGKVRYLLNAVEPACYLPMDISPDFLQESVNQLVADYPWLRVHPIAADFNQAITLPELPPPNKAVVFYPGSTIGNFEPPKAVEFLMRVKDWLTPNGGILLGVDLEKDHQILHAAYNDAQGVTAKFNLNILNNVNGILNSNFQTRDFCHRAFYNDSDHRIEMHLVAKRDHKVNCGSEKIHFKAGDSIHTENSYKYTLDGIAALAEQAGLQLQRSWCDGDNLFSMNYLIAQD